MKRGKARPDGARHGLIRPRHGHTRPRAAKAQPDVASRGHTRPHAATGRPFSATALFYLPPIFNSVFSSGPFIPWMPPTVRPVSEASIPVHSGWNYFSHILNLFKLDNLYYFPLKIFALYPVLELLCTILIRLWLYIATKWLLKSNRWQ